MTAPRMEATAAKPSAPPASPTTDRELVITRTFDAPRELVWEVLTDPKHLDQWWGPNGFRNTTHSMDARVGGSWMYVMHGPDGTDYENKITYREIRKPERLVYGHGDFEREHFQVTLTLEEVRGKTKVTMHSVFPSKDALEAVKKFGAVEGGEQTLAKLAGYVANLPNPASDMIVTRLFDAPRQLVWDAWSKPEMMRKWWGPKHFTTPVADLDFRKGGAYRIVMRAPDGTDFPFHGHFLEVNPIDRIVFDSIIENLKDTQLVTTVTFTDEGKKTRVTVRQQRPADPAASAGQFQGWSETLEKLAAALR